MCQYILRSDHIEMEFTKPKIKKNWSLCIWRDLPFWCVVCSSDIMWSYRCKVTGFSAFVYLKKKISTKIAAILISTTYDTSIACDWKRIKNLQQQIVTKIIEYQLLLYHSCGIEFIFVIVFGYWFFCTVHFFKNFVLMYIAK